MMKTEVANDGARLSVYAAGSGPPVLFVQGVGLPGAGWTPQTDVLQRGYSCVWFDHRGTGSTAASPDSVTVDRMADDCRAILDARSSGPAHVVGHSLGGLIALKLALDRPEQVRSLSLLCSFASGRAAAPPTRRMIWLGLRSRLGTRRMRRRGFLGIVLSPAGLAGADADEVAARLAPLFGHDLADQPSAVGRQLAAMRECDLSTRLGGLATIPTLVASAELDPIAPPTLGRAIADRIPGARFVELPNASHGVPIEFPGRVNDLLKGHFEAVDER